MCWITTVWRRNSKKQKSYGPILSRQWHRRSPLFWKKSPFFPNYSFGWGSPTQKGLEKPLSCGQLQLRGPVGLLLTHFSYKENFLKYMFSVRKVYGCYESKRRIMPIKSYSGWPNSRELIKYHAYLERITTIKIN